ncbi:hypothetical protein Ddye_019217 [Dipteronia dyeriana]|uniref:F-box domain-containing protein n=1 Tax=Dipteronia dyeriana TaxID=168575 RepID=A0AAD9TXX4_9ROSI|nr:hypothetical protein Ddye_019217 [Dipteronia dyeriana]
MLKLPEEIVADILSRLPVKTLMRFKCVCKPWLSLISSPHFAKRKLKQARAAAPHNNSRLFLASHPLQSIDYETFSGGGGDHDVSQEHAYPVTKAPEWDVQIVGSCDGLICLVFDYKDVILWNPSTRVSIELPPPDIPDLQDTFFCGFGYDISIQDYKLMMGVSFVATEDAKVQVLTLKNTCWRKIQPVDHSVDSIYKMGTLSNNALHWVWNQEFNYSIISFDLSGERFEELGIPDHLAKKYCVVNLGTMGGSLVIFCNPGNTHFESWVMKEYGVKSSWTRLFTVWGDTFPRYKYGPTLICFTKQGKVVLYIDESEWILYSPEEETFMEFVIKDDWGQFESIVYEESLVSPNGQ